MFDLNGDGVISTNELSKAMKEAGEELKEDEIKELLDAVDHSGTLNFQEFLRLMELAVAE